MTPAMTLSATKGLMVSYSEAGRSPNGYGDCSLTGM